MTKVVLILMTVGLATGVLVAVGIANFFTFPPSAGGAIAGLAAFASMLAINPFLRRRSS